MSPESRLSIGLLLCCQVLWIYGKCTDDSVYFIQSAVSSLVFEAKSTNVTVQQPDGSEPQLWYFKRGHKVGLFVITNKSTGKVLSFVKGVKNVVMADQNGSLNQQWALDLNGRIINAECKLNLDIRNGKYVPGNEVILWENNGYHAQNLVVVEKSLCLS